MRNKQFAFVPQWIDDVLKRNALASDSLLDFEKVAPFFSMVDLAGLVALGFKARLFTSYNVESDTLHWLSVWRISAKTPVNQKLVDDIATLANSESFQKETLDRIYAVSGHDSFGEKKQKETFEVSLLGNAGVRVSIRSGFTAPQHAANSPELFKCMVKQLYVYEEYHNLISRSVGATYIATLAV